jgi:Spy/CpxP family protein refolding chaperone
MWAKVSDDRNGKTEMSDEMTKTRSAFLRRWIGISIWLIASVVSEVASAHSAGGPGVPGPEMHVRQIERRLDAVGATVEQKSQIQAIIKQAFTDLADLRGQRRTHRQTLHSLLAQPVIDRAQIETLRVQLLALDDVASKRWLKAVADAAEVLTPEQRAAMAQAFKVRSGLPR